MKAKKLVAMAMGATMIMSMAVPAAASEDLFDPANYKSDKDSSEWTIAVVTKDNTANWFKRMEVGVNEFGEETGINVIQKGPANADAASQVQVIDDMINQGVDAICVVPIDPGAIEASLQTAMEKGIVVVTHEASNQVNTLYDTEAFTSEDFGGSSYGCPCKRYGRRRQICRDGCLYNQYNPYGVCKRTESTSGRGISKYGTDQRRRCSDLRI